MQNRCCAVGCNLNNSSKAYTHWLATLKILRNFILRRAFTVYMKTHCGLKFHFGQFDRGEISTEVKLYPVHVNADNEVTSHRSETLSRSEISNRFEFTLGLM